MVSRERKLAELLRNLFRDRESFLRFIRYGPSGERVINDLQLGETLPRLIFRATDILQRRGLLTSEFFGRLTEHFPDEAVAISSMEASWVPSLAEWSSRNDASSDVLEGALSQPPSLFVSYTRRDSIFLDELLTHLRILRRQGFLESWSEGRLRAGEEWSSVFSAQIQAADVIVLLVSSDFLSSDFVWDAELDRALKRMDSGSTELVPVLVRPCGWKETPLGTLHIFPTDGIAINEREDPDAAWVEVARTLRTMLEARRRTAR